MKKPTVKSRTVRAEPDFEQVVDQARELAPWRGSGNNHHRAAVIVPADRIQWTLLWPDGEISRHVTALDVLREVRRQDERAAKTADRYRAAVIFITRIEWENVPIGFVPPKSEDL